MAAGVSLLRFRNTEQEYKALTLNLKSQLYWDILKIYSESIFYDVEIQFESSSIKTHSSFLLLYAPHFYAELLRLKESRNLVFLDKAKEHVETFIRALYQPPKKCLKEKETKLVERLQFFLKTSGDESQDLFLTPDSTASIEDKSDNDRSHLVPSYFSTNQLYYALITLDESYLNDSGVEHLEKELIEQDQLSESLRSLRENHITPLKSKSNQQVHNQKNLLKKGSRNKFTRLHSKSKNDEMSDSEKVCNKDCCFGEVMSKSTSKEASQSTIYSETSGIGSSERVGLSNDHDSGISSVCNGTNFNENNDTVKNSVSRPYHHTSTSHFINAPNGVGQIDRCPASTHDFETFIIDPTEKSSKNDTSVPFCGQVDGSDTTQKVNLDSVSKNPSENFPIDKEGLESKDGKSSPKVTKSEINERIISANDFNRMCCSVNNNASASNDNNVQGRVNYNRWLSRDLSNSALVESCSVFDCFDSRAWDVLNEEEREMMKSREYKTFLLKSFSDQISKKMSKMEKKKHETTISDLTKEDDRANWKTNAQNQLQKCCEIQPNPSAVRKDELVSIYQDSLEASQKCSPDSDKIPKNETPVSSSHHFFIDASSLLDETELSLPLSCLSFNNNQTESNCNQTLTCNINQMPEFCNQKANSMESALETDSVSVGGARPKITEPTSLTEIPRLIRQKTFELEPSEEKLAILRKEYEKQLGGKVFNDNRQSLEAQNGFDDNMTALEVNGDDIKAELQSYCQNNEALSLNSPDSLNNDDQPEENCIRKEMIDDSLNTNFMLGKIGKCVEKKVSNCSNELSASSTSHLSLKSAKDKEVNLLFSGKNNLCSGKPSKLNCLESIPIVSGGIGVKDISNSISLGHSNNASPSMSRKIESSPIMSSGAVSIESEPKFRQKRVNQLNGESWVINLSDLSKSSNTSRFDDSEDASTPPRSAKSSSSGSSFFIDLNELPKEQDSNNLSSSPKALNHVKLVKNSRKEFQKVLSVEKTKVDQNQQTRSCGFFVNLNGEPLPNSQSTAGKESNDNLFTMFIDLNNPSSGSNSLEQPTKAALIKKRLQTQAEKFSLKQNAKSDSKNQSDSEYEHPEITKGKHLFSSYASASSHSSSTSHFKLIKSESLSDSQSDNTSTSQSKHLSETASLRVKSAPVKHKRTHSISIDKIQQQINRIPDVDKFSSAQKMVCSGPASLNTNSRKGKMTTSWHGANETREKTQGLVKLATVDDLLDIKLEKPDESLSISNHTDFSNSTSISEMGNSKNTFILDEDDIARNPQLTYNLDTSGTSHDNASDLSKDDNSSSDLSKTETNLKSSSDRGIGKIAISQKTDTNHSKVDDSFVKLSDMDKEPLKKSSSRRGVTNRMSRSIPEMSWIESKLQSKSAASRSLNRLFPQLSASINSRTSDYSDTDLSTISSMHSSLEPSVLDSTEDSEQETKNCSQLGEDLLRMFLDEISPDVIVEVGGRRIKAHKCILSSRCQYFAAILSGGWVQSAGDVISLQGFSYSVVHFALCHIYSGASNIPDSISLVELATLADMLCLEGLKEVISYTLKLKYCHFFHKPCSICTVGVLECLTLAAAYGLDDLYRKCLRWINKYFTKLWITKPFASLPRELIDKCYKQLVAHITVECILDMLLNCKTLSDNIPSSRWAETLHELAKRLNDACVKYTSQHFAAIISSNKFAVLLKDSSVDRSLIQLHILRAAELLSPDESCKSYSAINKLVSLNRSQEGIPDVHFIEFLNEIHTKVEEVLVKLARRAVKTISWTLLDVDLRSKIQKRAGLVFIPGTDKSKLRSSNNRHESTNSRTMELHKVKLVINGESEETANKANSNNTSRPKTWPSQNFAQVKSRYLEQRPTRNNVRSTVSNAPEKKLTPLFQRRPVKTQSNKISSSDSSRTQSPAATRSVNNSTLNTRSSQRTPLSRQKDTHTQDSVELAKSKPLSSRKPSLTQTKTPNTNVNSTRTHNMRVAARNAAKKNGIAPKIATSLTEKKSTIQSPMSSRKNVPRPTNANSSNAENKSPLKQRAKPLAKDKATASGLTVRQGNFSNSDNKVPKNINGVKMTQNKPDSSKPDKQGSLHSSSRSGTFCKD